ncbi:MAG: hypothetical protein U5R46_10480 [Gammaproteobacteria bacterium]|nr:hypothetical protein [Gammaproteobacteria bacterium]
MTGPAQRPQRAHLVVLFAVSGAMLAFEVLLVRLFEFSHWHHFAGLSISLALLGLGAAGTYLALRGKRNAVHTDGILVAGLAIQATGTLLVLVMHSQVALRPLIAAWEGRELARLLVVDFSAFVPFLGAGLVIGDVFARWPSASRRIYAANLFGAGAGSIAASGLLMIMDVAPALALVALIPAMALLLFAIARRSPWTAAAGALLCVAGVATVLRPPAPMVSDFKALSQVLDPADATLLETRPGLAGRLSVVRSDSQRYAPGLSLGWTDAVPPSDALVLGSDHLVPMPRRFPAGAAHMGASLAGLPLLLRPEGTVLVLGTSAWQSQVAATDREMVWVESDGRFLNLAARRGIAGAASELIEDSPYRYLASNDRRFELIALDGLFAGGDAASEDYLMTVEGLAAAMERLAPRGLLALPLEHSVPPRHFPRALATLHDALQRFATGKAGDRVAVLRGLQAMLVLASPNPLSADDLDRIRRFAEQWRFDLVWLPALPEADANRYHRLDAPLFHLSARAVFEQTEPPEAARWFTTTPATLARPYFWRSLSWERVPDFLSAMGRQRALSYLDWTLLLTAASAVLAVLLALVLIVAPLGRLPPAAGVIGRGTVAVYFSALGLGYMLLELAVFQRVIMFVGEPVVAAALVFTVFLIGSGLGSAGAPTTARPRDAARIFLAIAAGLVPAIAVLWPLSDQVLGMPRLPGTVVLAAALAPLTWAMGRAFPWALRLLAGRDRWVPWAWGINGFASVVAASLAVLISVQWGQPATLGAAMACYAVAALVALRWVGGGQGSGELDC